MYLLDPVNSTLGLIGAAASTLMHDTFSDAEDTALNTNAPDTVQNGAEVWAGDAQITINATGQARCSNTTPGSVFYDVGSTAFTATISFRFDAAAAANNRFGIIVRGSTDANCLWARIKTGASDTIVMIDRASGVDTEYDSQILTIDPKTQYYTFTITDEGAGGDVYITAVDDSSLTSTITSAQIAADSAYAADNNIGLFWHAVPTANHSLLDSIEVVNA